jgi:putative peptide zinc metalloprotease protein
MPTESHPSSGRIAWHRRADLQTTPLEFAGRRSWGVKDPLTLGYFELSDEEFFVLNRLDGSATVDEVCLAFHEQFRPRSLAPSELQGFVGQLVSQGLLVADGPGYGHALVARGRALTRRHRLSRLANVLVIRFRGVDPDRLLGSMMSWLGWLFSPWAVGAGLLLMVAAITLVVVQFDSLVDRMPETQALLTARNLAWLAVLLAMVKVLHEFGHGLTCKRFGGECRELGAMLLVFTPTLYCNVSDMWMVPDKWKRIAVSAAGMWVEAVIASVCTLLWWFSAPGLFHSLCFNLMFLCGVSTFLFNGNPLLRYDGYFILADWLEIPNLQQQSAAAVRGRLSRWFWGIDPQVSSCDAPPREWLLLTYGVASSIYRIGLTFAILWSLYRWLEPHGLGVFVQVFAVPTIGFMVLTPLVSTVQFLTSPTHRARINWWQFGRRGTAALIAVVLLLNLPLPGRVVAGALLDQDTAQRVYATFEGTLVSGAKIGERVRAGQEVARLVDPRVQSELIRLDGEVRLHRQRLQHFERRRVTEPEVASLIPTVREALNDFEQQLAQWTKDAERLVLRAPCDGIVLPGPSQKALESDDSLRTWAGNPLDDQNRGCFIRAGTTVCLVGPEQSREALVLVNQDDINFVRPDQKVHLLWKELAGEVLTGRIIEVAALDLNLLSRDAVLRLQLPARQSATGQLRPVGTWYQVRTKLDETDAPLPRGAAGDAKILVAPQSLWTRLTRWLARTFPI